MPSKGFVSGSMAHSREPERMTRFFELIKRNTARLKKAIDAARAVSACSAALQILAFALLSVASAVAKECPNGQAAHERSGWKWIANNALRTADSYAVKHGKPEATAIFGDVSVYYQLDGEYQGRYLVGILDRGTLGTTFMMLNPRFDFCGDPALLDDERTDLFEVVVAKFNGRKF